MSDGCVIDVGANEGLFMLEAAARRPDLRVVGIEPIPEFLELIRSRCQGLPNVTLVQAAIDTVEGRRQFNVARHADGGVSSLLNFDVDKVCQDEYWRERPDLYFEESINVDVLRMETLLDRLGVEAVDFVKIDAQGMDLHVLESFGRFLPRLAGGMLEVPTTRYATLYQEEPQDLLMALRFLERHGFVPYAIKPNDPACAEVNVFFHRRDVDWRVLEADLRLRGIALYDGKHYWHEPADRLHAGRAAPCGELTELRAALEQLQQEAASERARQQAEAERTHGENARLQAELDRAYGENARLQTAIEQTRVDTARLKAESDRASADNDRLHQESERLQDRIARSESVSEQLRRSLSAAVAEREEHAATLRSAASREALLRGAVHALQSRQAADRRERERFLLSVARTIIDPNSPA